MSTLLSSVSPELSGAAPIPLSFGGVVPSLAQCADFGPPRSECGIGCLMPWNGKLYVLNYVSHRRKTGSGTGLRVIEGDFTMTVHPEAVDGTYANRMVHYPSSQLIIGPHVIDQYHQVRTVPELIDIRLCGTAVHLTQPEELVYMLGMEGELFELNVYTLEARQIFDLVKEFGIPGEGNCHFKDCYSAFGKLVVTNNDYTGEDFSGGRQEGTLAEYDGKSWRILERKPFVCVQGRGRYSDVIFATGWDRSSAILKVYTHSDKTWRTYRLPKGTHTHDHKWQSEWPRIREVEHERFLMDLHGTFYELSPWAYEGKIWGITPISRHLWVLGDFCSWKGMLVLGSDNASPSNGANALCAEPQSGLWFGKTDDLWQFGKPKGWGGPWWDTAVTAGEASDPYLMTGFDHKALHLHHCHHAPVLFDVEVDFQGNGNWHRYTSISVAPGGYESFVFPTGFSVHWIRVKASVDCIATAQLHYS